MSNWKTWAVIVCSQSVTDDNLDNCSPGRNSEMRFKDQQWHQTSRHCSSWWGKMNNLNSWVVLHGSFIFSYYHACCIYLHLCLPVRVHVTVCLYVMVVVCDHDWVCLSLCLLPMSLHAGSISPHFACQSRMYLVLSCTKCVVASLLHGFLQYVYHLCKHHCIVCLIHIPCLSHSESMLLSVSVFVRHLVCFV